ncbi:hypothetical protein ST27_21510 [Xanthomonas phaseoli pv. phaseoli]|nr:hypothetical protein ST27_21510 [Xanthomonas phaseoli pv. phaseoli]
MLALRELVEARAVRAPGVVTSEGIGFSTVAILLPFLVEAFVFPICRLNLLLQLAQRAHGLFQKQSATRVCGAAVLHRSRWGALVFRIRRPCGEATYSTSFQGTLMCLRNVCCWRHSRPMLSEREI